MCGVATSLPATVVRERYVKFFVRELQQGRPWRAWTAFGP